MINQLIKNDMRESRLVNSQFNIRSDDEDRSLTIDGWASVFNKGSKLISENGKNFIEHINPNAFSKALERGDLNVVANRDHNDRKLLARSKSGTLSLSVEEYGLRYTFTPPDTELGKETIELIQRGDLYESSFRYSVKPSNIRWWREGDDSLHREILEVEKIFDVSVVVNGAFSGTNISVRDLDEFEAQETIEKEKIRSQELEEYYNKLNTEFYEE